MLSRRDKTRNAQGVVLPFVMAALLLFVAFAAFATDVSRSYLTARHLEFAADAAALYAYSRALNADGSYTKDSAQNNIVAALDKVSGSTPVWNGALAGSGSQKEAINFQGDDIQFAENPSDPTEVVLRLIARRDGDQALTQYFMPAVFAATVMHGGTVPDDARAATIVRVTEVVGQPATRIGAGSLVDWTPFAAFPLVLSNAGFLPAAAAGVGAQFPVDLVSSNGTPVTAGRLRAAFANVARGSAFSGYYAGNTGGAAALQLGDLLRYFGDHSGLSPAAVERGVKLGAFDPAGADFQSAKSNLLTQIKKIPLNTRLIVPVVAGDPQFGGAPNTVVGFARLRLTRATNATGDQFALVLQVEESVPVPNAACDPAHTTVPAFANALLPLPVAPFKPRQLQDNPAAISARASALVLAPSLSPRICRLN